jgi:GAF domain-containing protein
MEHWERVKRLVDEALTLDGSERERFLAEQCAAEASLRADVESLLAHEHDALLGSGRDGPDEPPAASDPRATLATGEAGSGLDAEAAEAADRPAHPFRKVVWVLSVLMLVQLGFAVRELVVAAGMGTAFGWFATEGEGGWVVAEVSPDGPASGLLRPGDRVGALDGVPPIGPLGLRYQHRVLNAGDRYTLSIEREGLPGDLALQVAAARDPIAPQLVYLLLGLVWGAVGLFVGFARPDQPLARLSCLAAVAAGQVFLDVGIVQRILNVAPLHGVLGFHFFSRFPSGERLGGGWRRFLLLLYAGAVPWNLLAACTSTLVLLNGPAEATRFAGAIPIAHRLAMFTLLGAIAGIFVVIPWNYRRLRDPDLRRRVRWMVYGSSLALLPNFWWLAAMLSTGEPGFQLSLFTNGSSVVVPLCMAYVVLKHRVLGIRVVIRRGLQYLLARRALQLAVTLPVAVLVWAAVVNRHRTLAQLASENQGYLLWLAVAAAALRFRQPIRSCLDRRFFAEQYDREQLLLGLLQDVRKVDSLSELARLVTSRLDAVLHPRAMYLWYRDPGELASAASSDPDLTPPDLPAGGHWLAWLERHASAVTLPVPSEAGMSRQEARWFAARGVHLAIPIADADEKLVGALFLAEKQSEEPYSLSDQRLLEAIARQTAVVRETLRLRARVSEDARVRHEVLPGWTVSSPGCSSSVPPAGAASTATSGFASTTASP